MVNIRKATPEDALAFQIVEWQHAPDALKRKLAQLIRSNVPAHESYAICYGDAPVMLIGMHEVWEGRHVAYAWVSEAFYPVAFSATRAIKRWLHNNPRVRIEAHVRFLDCRTDTDIPYTAPDFRAINWLRHLGFECEARAMRGFYPDGQSASQYARTLL